MVNPHLPFHFWLWPPFECISTELFDSSKHDSALYSCALLTRDLESLFLSRFDITNFEASYSEHGQFIPLAHVSCAGFLFTGISFTQIVTYRYFRIDVSSTFVITWLFWSLLIKFDILAFYDNLWMYFASLPN